MVTPSRIARPRRVAIIGAGMAGLACAQRLTAAGVSVRLLDKGRGAGGRMSTRRIETPLGEACFDFGAPFFVARDPDFRLCVEGWILAGHACAWPSEGPEAVVGRPSMNAPLKAMAQDLDVARSAHVTGLRRAPAGWMVDVMPPGLPEGPFDAVVLAIPPEQATLLLNPHAFDLAVCSAKALSAPIWTAMVVFDAPVLLDPGRPGPCETLALAVSENSKPGRAGPEAWTLQATPEWSQANLESAAPLIATRLVDTLARRLPRPLPQVVALQAHRWRYARPAASASASAFGPVWRETVGLGLCGDWVQGDGVEAAWVSGVRLADRICASPSLAEALPEPAAAL